jgi:receptor expression-enhancing protein 5/6
LVGFVWPVYASFKALKSADTADDTQWLTYWIVFGIVSTVESFTDFLLQT